VSLSEGVDYVIDVQGRLVFSATYHLRRGYCCGNKCRNCPFGWDAVPAEKLCAGEPQPPLDQQFVARAPTTDNKSSI
jgi:Family of unknown function (DUF5522)